MQKPTNQPEKLQHKHIKQVKCADILGRFKAGWVFLYIFDYNETKTIICECADHLMIYELLDSVGMKF